jgi:fatty-acyl-CoA synthase
MKHGSARSLRTDAWPEFDERTASALCYTSGTTGNPKGVLYSHRSTLLHALAGSLPDSTAMSAQECVLPVVPMFHVNGWGVPYSAPMTGANSCSRVRRSTVSRSMS